VNTLAPAERWKALAAKFGIYALAGLVAGAIGLGIVTFRGGMRLVTITSGQEGRFTDNGAIAGEFTLEGTLFLVLAGTVLGMVLSLLIGLVREGTRTKAWIATLIFTPLVTRLLLLDPDNPDFVRFGPAWVAVATFTLGVALYLAFVGLLVDRLESRWHLPRPLLMVAGVVGSGFLVLAFLGSGGVGLVPLLGLAFLVAMVGGLWTGSAWHAPAARVLLWGGAVIGLIIWVQATVQIL
jgi:hypothetical protein